MRPIEAVAEDLGLRSSDITHWGPGTAKLNADVVFPPHPQQKKGKLVLVTAISPTPAARARLTTTIGLTQAARKNGVRAACALREPSLGPIFGVKGGGTGGGKSILEPSDRINLHFTGDLHAITAAHNLLAAVADVDLYFGQPAKLDGRQMTFRRALDMNDRFLRKMVIGLGGKSMGSPREDGFDITAASEVMAILCLSRDYADLKTRLGNILVGYGRDGSPVYARDLQTHGAMAALLRDALLPNLVQTVEGAPALVHGGPFANIAHGCNSITATRALLWSVRTSCSPRRASAATLGAEKFLDIKCRTAGVFPERGRARRERCARSSYHGGVPAAESGGLRTRRHWRKASRTSTSTSRAFAASASIRSSRSTSAAAIRRTSSTGCRRTVKALGVDSAVADVYGQGGDGALELAKKVVAHAHAKGADAALHLRALRSADGEDAQGRAHDLRRRRRRLHVGREGHDRSRGQARYGRGADLRGEDALVIEYRRQAPRSSARLPHTVREARLSAGVGFIVMLTGEILTMPGLPKTPQAVKIDPMPDGTITGIV